MLGPAEGRVPSIHGFRRAEKGVDARNKSAHDDRCESSAETFATRSQEPDSRGLVPGIHVSPEHEEPESYDSTPTTWMAGTGPAMTKSGVCELPCQSKRPPAMLAADVIAASPGSGLAGPGPPEPLRDRSPRATKGTYQQLRLRSSKFSRYVLFIELHLAESPSEAFLDRDQHTPARGQAT